MVDGIGLAGLRRAGVLECWCESGSGVDWTWTGLGWAGLDWIGWDWTEAQKQGS